MIDWGSFPEAFGPHQPPASSKLLAGTDPSSSSQHHQVRCHGSMNSYTSSATARAVILAVLFAATVWLVAVPAVVTTSSFLAVLGIAAAFWWIAATTYLNAQPASSLAQSLHDADQTRPSRQQSDGR